MRSKLGFLILGLSFAGIITGTKNVSAIENTDNKASGNDTIGSTSIILKIDENDYSCTNSSDSKLICKIKDNSLIISNKNSDNIFEDVEITNDGKSYICSVSEDLSVAECNKCYSFSNNK